MGNRETQTKRESERMGGGIGAPPQPKKDFWQTYLESMPVGLEGLSARPRPAKPGRRRMELVSFSQHELLKNRAEQWRLPYDALLISAVHILIHHYSGVADFGTVLRDLANRQDHRLLRAEFSYPLSFRDYAGRMAIVLEEMSQAESLNDFDAGKINPHIDGSGFHPLAAVAVDLGPIDDVHGSQPAFICRFHFDLEPREPRLAVFYEEEMFETARIQGMLEGFSVLIDQVSQFPDRPFPLLDLQTQADRAFIHRVNDVMAPLPEITLHGSLEKFAKERPQQLGVISEQGRFSYQETNALSNQVAAWLLEEGVKPGDLVGVCLKRGMHMVQAVLGICKAGAGYVPLDPDLPDERIEFIIEDTGMEVVLSERRFQQILHKAPRVMCMDTKAWQKYPEDNTGIPVIPEATAMVLYTSGSTGRPKGALVSHRSYVSLWCNSNLADLGHEDVVLQFAPFSFDAAAMEIWGAFLRGAALAVFKETIPSLDELATYIREQKVTWIFFSASLFRQMVEHHLDDLKGVTHISSGGDVMSVHHACMAAKICPRITNGYGPTENAALTTIHDVDPDRNYHEGIPIGYNLTNNYCIILNQYMQPVPLGTAGELFIGGPGLADAYLGRPSLSAERYVPDPFSGEPGARLYRSGDLVRFMPDGEIQFLGRIDHQVKIRGFRIELGEVEAALMSCPGVRMAVGMAREDTPGDKRLVAYLTATDEAPAGPELRRQVRSWLIEKLPPFMVPSSIVVLDELPLTRHGKVDRKQLPVPTKEDLAEEAFSAPETEMEQLLADYFAEFLGHDRIGRDDHFFLLGGHSLLATKVVARIRGQYKVDVNVHTLSNHPTPAKFAAEIERLLAAGETAEDSRILPVSRQGRLPLSFSEQRLWFINQIEPDNPVYHISHNLAFTGKLDYALWRRALEILVERHEILRTAFPQTAREPFRDIHESIDIDFRLHDLRGTAESGDEKALLQRWEALVSQAFDFERPPLWRMELLRLEDELHLMNLVMHHIIGDGLSMEILVDDLARIYNALQAGEEPACQVQSVAYADYAAWQRKTLTRAKQKELGRWWRTYLSGELQVLPTEKPRPERNLNQGDVVLFQLPDDLAATIDSFCREQNLTPFILFQTAFRTMLYRFSGLADLPMGTAAAGRDSEEVERLIGFFINNVVLRCPLQPERSVSDNLAQVKENTMEAFSRQELPFDQVVEAVNPRRDTSFSPLFQVMTVYLSHESEPTTFDGLQSKSVRVEVERSMYDLVLHMESRKVQQSRQLEGLISFNPALFRRATIESFVDAFPHILRAFLDQFESPLGQVAAGFDLEKKHLYYVDPVIVTPAVEKDDARSSGPKGVAIGRANRNYQIYLLDAYQNPVPRGVPGEICISGSSQARGYLGKAAMTAEKFVPNPFSFVPGSRMYRTGDLGVWNEDGVVVFLGRIDSQVKIRGFRIELGEIETVLKANPSVKDALVTAPKTASGDRLLAAYIIPEGEQAGRADMLREWVVEHLPEYMVPSGFTFLDVWPLNANGKIDRKKLPEPDFSAEGGGECGSETEREMAVLWSELLGRTGIGPRDNFFELGGHSLLSMKVLGRVSQQWQVELPPQTIFENPVLGDFCRVVDQLRGPAVEIIPRCDRTQTIPLSLSQERLWFIDRMEPGNTAYIIPKVIRVRGLYNPDFIHGLLVTVIARHEALRTAVKTVNGQAVQVIHDHVEPDLSELDLSHLPRERAEKLGLEQALAFAFRPFDLAQAPLFRVMLVRIDQDSYYMTTSLHHIISDGWSTGVLADELAELSRAFSQGIEPVLPELPIQFADFAVWQRQRMQSEKVKPQIDFWARELAGCDGILDLPTDYPRPKAQTFRGALVTSELSAGKMKGLQGLAEKHGATMFMTLLAAYYQLLHRLSGQDDILVGTPISGRDRLETRNVIGFFVNTVVLRGDLRGNPTFSAFLERVKNNALGVFSHQEIPFERIMEVVNPSRDMSRNPLYQVTFSYENFDTGAAEEAETGIITPVDIEFDIAQFDLSLTVTPSRDGSAKVGLRYNNDLFKRESAQRYLKAYLRLIEGILERDDQPILAYQLLREEEKAGVLAVCHAAQNLSRRQPRHLFTAVLRAADVERPALIFGEKSWSYGDLLAQSERVAAALIESGLQPGEPVGCYLGRDPRWYPAMLGIMRARGMYVPLDPAYPAGRLQFMIEDSGLKRVITDDEHRQKLPVSGLQALILDGNGHPIQSPAATVTLPEPSCEDPAYLIYTSGSSGSPKGVVVRHGQVVDHLYAVSQTYGLGFRDRLLHFASTNFDVSLEHMFCALINGLPLVVRDESLAWTPTHLAQSLAEHKITVLLLPTGFWSHWTGELTGDLALPNLRLVVVGGDALSAAGVKTWQKSALGQVPLFNAYGPTETVITATIFDCSEQPLESGVVPIGRALPGRHAYVVGEGGCLLPFGMPGELWIGGTLMADGYLNRDQLTQAAFLKNPFGEGRVYRTGDRVRMAESGVLSFLGRIDRQVKVRGYRIELGEIEAVLGQHPHIKSAAVTVFGEGADRGLAAYVVPHNDDLDTMQINRYLLDRLPRYMVPDHILTLAALPLTANGKLDRKALPAPDSGLVEKPYRPPETESEWALSSIWANVLNREPISADDHFFQIGGHSLLAMQVLSRIAEGFGVELTPKAIFEYPVLCDLARYLDSFEGGGETQPIPTVDRRKPLPLSPTQERLWFIEQLDGGTPNYNMPMILRVRADFDSDRYRKALEILVERQESLRTRFGVESGRPVQIIDSRWSGYRFQDLRAANNAEQQGLDLARADAESGFDLYQGPLFRVTVFQLDNADFLISMNMHHIISDGWSLNLLREELGEIYQALSDDREPRLPALKVGYPDYAVWQQNHLAAGTLARQLSWWSDTLAGLPDLLELPTDFPRPKMQTYNGADLHFRIDEKQTRRLRHLAKANGVTLFMEMLGFYSLLLHKFSGADDLAVGTPHAGRHRRELEDIIGFFVNTLVTRHRFDGEPSFLDILAHLKTHIPAVFSHQDVPFEKVVEHLSRGRSTSYTPLFQVVFNMVGSDAAASLENGAVEVVDSGYTKAKFDLTLSLAESADGGLQGTLNYNTDLFREETASRFVRGYQALIDAVLVAPQTPLTRLDWLDEAESDMLMRHWGIGPANEPGFLDLMTQLGRQAETRPDAPFIISDEGSLSYAQSLARIDALAALLQQQGVGPEVSVAVCAPKGREALLGMLASMRAGGIYVPINDDFPEDRRRFMVEDCGARVMLVTQDTRELALDLDLTVIEIDSDHGDPSAFPFRAPLEHQAAYMIYTSGSTGRPKGVCVEHGNMLRLADGYVRLLNMTDKDRFLQFASLSFDASIMEIFCTVIRGGSLVVGGRDVLQPGEAMLDFMEKHKVNLIFMPPSAAAVLPYRALPDLRVMLTGGEVCSADLVEKWGKDRTFVNIYGPTEVTVVTTNSFPKPGSGKPTIGKPMPGEREYVLDRFQRPLPAGVAGELCIGGSGVSRGYLGRPGLTAARFVPDPFSDQPGARMYRSGDLVRWNHEGELDFLGRIDHQVKIRGFRIELGEIEAALKEREEVEQAVVLVHEAAGDQRIVAYWTALEPAVADDATSALLLEGLEARLPAFMVPSLLIPMAGFPTNSNGKVDRPKLPKPVFTVKSEYVAPEGPLQEKLAEIWAEMLGLAKVGAEDHFFQMGGHSLLATRVAFRVRDELGLEFPVRVLFENPTIRDLAAYLEEKGGIRAGETALTARGLDRAPLSYPQQRLWFIEQMDPGSNAYNIPSILEIKAPLEVAAYEQALKGLAQRQESLRTVFRQGEGRPYQFLLPEWHGFTYHDLSDQKDAYEQGFQLVSTAADQGFDLADGPLFRVVLVKIGVDHFLVCLCMHHIISDGWSIGVMLGELGGLYREALGHGSAHLPDLPVSYMDFSVWQRAFLEAGALEEQLQWWRDSLAELPDRLALPCDYPRPKIQTFNGRNLEFQVSPSLTKAFTALGRESGTTLFMQILAAYGVLLGRYAGSSDIAIGTPHAGRARPELQGLIGFFVNTLVMRVRLEEGISFRELLKRVRAYVLDAFGKADVPFEKLVESLKPERSTSHSPLFQVMFTMQNRGAFSGNPGELEGVKTLDHGLTVAKFDITFGIVERADGGLDGLLNYNSDLFHPQTAARMVAHFQTLLVAIVAAPDQAVDRLVIQSKEEQTQLLKKLGKGLPIQTPVVDMVRRFDDNAVRFAQRPCLVEKGRELTYAQAHRQVTELAAALQARGVGPEVKVAVCAPKGIEALVGLLAVIKAGGVYLPLAVDYPEERRRFLLEDASVSLILTTPETRPMLDPCSVPCLDITATRADIADFRENRPHPQQLAYIIYTSGSTGRPKGVAVPHHCLAVFADNMAADMGYDEETRMMPFASFSFDASILEMFCGLSRGAALVLAPREQLQPGPDLIRFMGDMKVNSSLLPPAGLAVMEHAPLPDLKVLISGGETVPKEVVEKWAPGRDFVNVYGPTETTVVASYDYNKAEEPKPLIGRPVRGASLYIVDRHGQLTAAGVPGELCIGGEGVTRGYLARPALTGERYVPDPFSGVPGSRMYRSGDLVRWTVDGRLDYLGRIDHQVKVRGFRIELGEIEAAITALDFVEQGVVVVREDIPGDKRIVAYWTPAKGVETGADACRDLLSALEAKLPPYMVPSAAVGMAAFPLTTAAKVDRRNLPAPQYQSDEVFREPQGATQRALAEIWQDLLGISQVGAGDNFFKVGGHSLLAVRLMANIAKRTGVKLPLTALFESPSLESLAARIDGGGGQTDDGLPVLLNGIDKGKPLFLVHPVGGNIFCYEPLARAATAFPLYGIKSPALNGESKPIQEMTALARSYVQSLRAVQPQGPYRLGGWSFGGVVAAAMAHELEEAGETVEHLLLIDSWAPVPGQPEPTMGECAQAFARDLAGMAAKAFDLDESRFETLDDDGAARLLLELAKAQDVLDRDEDASHFIALFKVFRANLLMMYRFQVPRLGMPITLLRADQLLAENAKHPRTLGWHAHAGKRIRVVDLEGHHYNIIGNHAETIVQQL